MCMCVCLSVHVCNIYAEYRRASELEFRLSASFPASVSVTTCTWDEGVCWSVEARSRGSHLCVSLWAVLSFHAILFFFGTRRKYCAERPGPQSSGSTIESVVAV